MRQELFIEVEVSEGVTVTLDNETFKVVGPEGEVSKAVKLGRLEVAMGNPIKIGSKTATKTEKRMMNTIAAHLRGMIQGVKEKWEYQVKICFGHFPFTIKQEGKKAIVKNFLGEKIDRVVKLVDGTDVDFGKEIITIRSVDKELAGQCAANFEAATKVRGRDKRIFQDGCYIIKKCGKEI